MVALMGLKKANSANKTTITNVADSDRRKENQ